MYEVPVMYVLNACDELISKKKNSLQGETAWAEIEKVFQRGAKQFHYHNIVVSFWATPFYCRDTNCWCKFIINNRKLKEFATCMSHFLYNYYKMIICIGFQ